MDNYLENLISIISAFDFYLITAIYDVLEQVSQEVNSDYHKTCQKYSWGHDFKRSTWDFYSDFHYLQIFPDTSPAVISLKKQFVLAQLASIWWNINYISEIINENTYILLKNQMIWQYVSQASELLSCDCRGTEMAGTLRTDHTYSTSHSALWQLWTVTEWVIGKWNLPVRVKSIRVLFSLSVWYMGVGNWHVILWPGVFYSIFTPSQHFRENNQGWSALTSYKVKKSSFSEWTKATIMERHCL